MSLKFKCLIILSCFLITFCKHYLIETDDNNSTSNTPSTDNYLNYREDSLGSKHYLIKTDDKNSTSNTPSTDNYLDDPEDRSMHFSISCC